MGDLLVLTGKIAIPATDVKRQTFRRWIGRFTGNPKAQHNEVEILAARSRGKNLVLNTIRR
jgi:hypothetical protein